MIRILQYNGFYDSIRGNVIGSGSTSTQHNSLYVYWIIADDVLLSAHNISIEGITFFERYPLNDFSLVLFTDDKYTWIVLMVCI